MNDTLQKALEELYGLERRRSKLGLGGTVRLLRALGDPQRSFRAVHVAGTNGKGSVCAMIERVLRAAGVRTGLFTSPHLVDFRERIRVEGRWADGGRLEERLSLLQSQPDASVSTFFEVCTALAFDDFAARAVDWAVVEVGLGGRLDCTNVLQPQLTVVTSIGLDHTEILGTTIPEIAGEKGGILKPGVPVVSNAIDPEADAVLRRIAAERGAPFVAAWERTPTLRRGPCQFEVSDSGWGPMTLELPQGASFPAENVATAVAALGMLREGGLEISREAVAQGLAATRWPGRLEPCPSAPRLWWDGAHNAQGAAALAQLWGEADLPPAGALVLAASRDKNIDLMLVALAAIVPDRRLVATRTCSERALDPAQIAARATSAGWSAEVADSVVAGCRRGLAWTARQPVVLTGSLFAVGEAMEAFGGAPGEFQ